MTEPLPAELAAIQAQYRLFMIQLRPGVAPGWSNVRGMIIRARDADHARSIAADMASHLSHWTDWWLSDTYSRVDPLEQAGPPGVVLSNIDACVDPDHGIGDHPCDQVLGAERAAALRDPGDDAFEAAREFDRTHPGYWEWTEEETR